MSYFIPTRSNKKIPKILTNPPENCLDKLWKKLKETSGAESTQWIYLHDCVSRGTIKPFEAYDCLKAGYVLEHLKSRDSYYEEML